MKKALLAALVLIGGAGVAIYLVRHGKPPVAPVALPVDAGAAEASTLFVARTEPPSIWRVFASGKVERQNIDADIETSEGPEGSTLPRVSPDGKRVAFIRQANLVIRELASGTETRVTTDGRRADSKTASVDVSIIAWSADGQKLAFHVGESQGIETEDGADLEVPKVNYGNFVFDGKQATKIELPAEVIAWLPDGSFLLSEAGQAQPATTRLLRWEIGQAAAPISLPAGHYGQVQVGRGWRYAVASVANAIGKDSRIVRWDLKKPIPEAVTTRGGWAEYQWPRLSPNEQQVAFVRGADLWVRDHQVLHPAQQLVNYDWIDDQTLVVETPGELIVVGVDRQVRGRVSVVARDGGP